LNAINCGGCAPPVIVETERQRDQRVADELRMQRATAAMLPVEPTDEMRAAHAEYGDSAAWWTTLRSAILQGSM
jgi:hypothetical protein